MTTLTYGFILPQSGDKGSSLWSALEANITQLNSHSHNGTDSALVARSSLAAGTGSIASSDWASYVGAPTGHYRQLVNLPAGYTFDNTTISIRTSDGKYVCATIEKNDNTSYYIYSLDNTVNFTAVYGG